MTIKLKYMQSVLKISLAAMLAVSLAACGSSSKDGSGDLKDKKAELEKLKAQQAEVNGKIQNSKMSWQSWILHWQKKAK